MMSGRYFGNNESTLVLRPFGRLTLVLLGTGVIFASLGLGEAVYRILFFEFDGATDRLPLEALAGLTFAWLAGNFVKRFYQRRLEANARIKAIRDRNHKIRRAVEGIVPVLPSHQQAIRVIREEVERIDMEVTDILPSDPGRQPLSERLATFI